MNREEKKEAVCDQILADLRTARSAMDSLEEMVRDIKGESIEVCPAGSVTRVTAAMAHYLREVPMMVGLLVMYHTEAADNHGEPMPEWERRLFKQVLNSLERSFASYQIQAGTKGVGVPPPSNPPEQSSDFGWDNTAAGRLLRGIFEDFKNRKKPE